MLTPCAHLLFSIACRNISGDVFVSELLGSPLVDVQELIPVFLLGLWAALRVVCFLSLFYGQKESR